MWLIGLAVVLTLSLILAPPAGEAQPGARTARVGVLLPVLLIEMIGAAPADPLVRGFIRELRALRWIEGQNLIVERRAAQGPFVGNIVHELVGLQCDVIVVVGTEMAHEARQVTTTVPIVVWGFRDPVASGLAASLARPGGNVTGIQVGVGPDVHGKSLQLLKEAVPKAVRVAILEHRGMWEGTAGQHQRAAAATLGLTLMQLNPAPWEHALDEITRQRPDAVAVVGGPFLSWNRDRIIDLMNQIRIPLMTRERDFTETGGLMSYGTSLGEYGRRIAHYVNRILRGANPGDLPIEGPSKDELVINLKTAKTLGLTIPQSLLVRANEIIQ